MNALRVSVLLLLTLVALFAGGCCVQPPAKAQVAIDVEFTLTAAMDAGRMVYKGVGGEIDGVTNPNLVALRGDTVRITLINSDSMPHDLAIPDFGAGTRVISAKEQTTEVVFEVPTAGEFAYFCTVSGHRQAGMEGVFVVRDP